MRTAYFLCALMIGSTSLFGCSSDDDSAGAATGGTGGTGASPGGGGSNAAPKDIVDTAVAAGNFTKLAGALGSAGLVDALKGKGPFTVFAPDDAAFAAFEAKNPGVLASLDQGALAAVLEYHVVAGAAVKASALKDGQVFTTLAGPPALVGTTGGVTVDDAHVTTPDIEASNGVIHVIDTIILPPKDDIVATAVAAGTFKSLAGALGDAGLVSTLKGNGPFTVFAPTDDAFAKLSSVPQGDALKNVLLYHVAAGAVGSGDLKAGPLPTLLAGQDITVSLSSGVSLNDAKVVKANVLAKNGVIHVIDSVLLPK